MYEGVMHMEIWRERVNLIRDEQIATENRINRNNAPEVSPDVVNKVNMNRREIRMK